MAQNPSKDPYEILGVARTAGDDEIKKTYRKLARQLHPDLTGGDAEKAERFKAVNDAYNFLRDAENRRRYDAGEIDADGQEKAPRQSYRSYAETNPSGRYEHEGGFDDLGDIFSRAFRQGSPFGNAKIPGQDVHFQMEISFIDSVIGATLPITLPGIGQIELRVPAGISEGQSLRLAGKGGAGTNGGPSGDAYVAISVAADPIFTRDGDDVSLDLPISIDEAVLGGSVEVPIPGGRVKLKVPPGSSSGKVMRLRGKGVQRAGKSGDLLVTLQITLPAGDDPALTEAIRTWRQDHSYDPRSGWKGNRT